jgi:hypothetical protein
VENVAHHKLDHPSSSQPRAEAIERRLGLPGDDVPDSSWAPPGELLPSIYLAAHRGRMRKSNSQLGSNFWGLQAPAEDVE